MNLEKTGRIGHRCRPMDTDGECVIGANSNEGGGSCLQNILWFVVMRKTSAVAEVENVDGAFFV
jgi:hypothetical protein